MNTNVGNYFVYLNTIEHDWMTILFIFFKYFFYKILIVFILFQNMISVAILVDKF